MKKTATIGALIATGALATTGLSVAPAGAAPSTSTPQTQLSAMQDRYVASVVAPNGDRQPYGVAVVPAGGLGKLKPGNVIVTDFSNGAGVQGAGTSILEVDPASGASSLLLQDPKVTGPVGLALNPTSGTLWVGAYGPANPTTGVYDGSQSSVQLVLPSGAAGPTYTNANTAGATNLTGVWGQGVSKTAAGVSFYWGNAGNAATGTGGGDIWRVDPHPAATSKNGQPINSTYVKLADGQAATPAGNNAVGAVGPQAIAVDNATGTAYVTNDADSSLIALPGAATATGPVNPQLLTKGGALNSPENVVINPVNGDLLVVNGAGNNNLVELTTSGQVVATRDLAPGQAPGALFGLTATKDASGNLVLYYVNQADNSLHQLSTTPAANGYHLVAADGGVFSYGGAAYNGSTGAIKLNAPIVATAGTPGGGYWMAASDGGVFAFGDAPFEGSAATKSLAGPVVGMARSAGSRGYWLADSAGEVFSFGDAPSLGSAHPASPIVAIVATPDGAGYWLVASDGGVFSFGDASFFGSTGAIALNRPIVAAAATADGAGYWLVASDGGVFSFGDATFFGSAGATHLNQPIVGITRVP
ncbi:MAG: hypothetical protein NVS3B12_31650 [Acidimicrobiales bacterium]